MKYGSKGKRVRQFSILLAVLLATGNAYAATITASLSDYRAKLQSLMPGDVLLLEAGTYDDSNGYPGLSVYGLKGESTNPIIITGPESGPRPVFLGSAGSNTIRIANSSYVIIRNIDVDGRDRGGDGINGQDVSHHITLENITISGVGPDQSIVGISTNRAPTWNWIIRNNIIIGAGTGIYLGDSNGTEPFINGTIENNVILDTIGYNIEIKHQIIRSSMPGMPTSDSTTIIRHNVFSKSANSSGGSFARPAVLVGHFPPSGPGENDVYQIYGNFFFNNPSGEPLLQAEGNAVIHNNLFVNNVGDAILVQPHNDVPKMIRIFSNTIVASGVGIRVSGGSLDFEQKVIGNAVFAANPINAADQFDNVTDSYTAAVNYLNSPGGDPLDGTLDLYPLQGKLLNMGIDNSSYNTFVDWNLDFNGNVRESGYRGAYSGAGQNPGWLPRLNFKPLTGSPIDVLPPAAPAGLIAQ
ncbi:hypothetical protein JYT26_01765 [Beggiatoa alba]|nr:hypothetical protein [Beggiatoa alba]